MSFVYISQDLLAYAILLLIILVSALYFYVFFESLRSSSLYPPIVVNKLNTESPSNSKNIKDQPLPSFHPEYIPDEIKEIGLIPFLRKKHLKDGWIVTDLPLENTLSVIDPIAIRSSIYIGDRPKNMYQFLEPIWGKDNLQVFSAERADKYRKIFGPALTADGKKIYYFDTCIKQIK